MGLTPSQLWFGILDLGSLNINTLRSTTPETESTNPSILLQSFSLSTISKLKRDINGNPENLYIGAVLGVSLSQEVEVSS